MLTREQERAQHAYRCVREVVEDKDVSFDDYRTLINGLGANIMRSGLAATVAFVQRYRNEKVVGLFWKHLAGAKIHYLEGVSSKDLAEKIYELELNQYMHVTREMLKQALWFRRATQAYKAQSDHKGEAQNA